MKSPAKPKVAFKWTEEGRETKALCRLCNAPFWGYSRNSLYVSTARHKQTCPKLAEWVRECRRLELERQM